MVWPWSSTSQSAEPSAPPPPASQSPSPTTTPDLPPPKAVSREEAADREWNSLLQELEADLKPSSTKYNRVPRIPPPPPGSAPRQSSQPSSSTTSSNSTEDSTARSLTLEESLLPTSMSCRQAFDSAFYCQSFGGQFNNLYRYGGIRDCGELWWDFWFCMKTRSLSGESKDSMVRDRYKRKALKYKVGPSSEDIWESREKRVEPGEAFSERFVEETVDDEEWNRRERIRRENKTAGTL